MTQKHIYTNCRGENWGGSRPIIGSQAGNLVSCTCSLALAHSLLDTHDMVKFGVVRAQSSDHSGLGSTPKLNFSVIVTPACAADMETKILVACGTAERGGAGFRMQCPGVSPDTGCTWCKKTMQRLSPVAAWELSGVLPHTLQTKEVGLLGQVFPAVDCCVVVADELQAEFIYKHVEDATRWPAKGVGSVGIHDYVGVVRGPNEKLHEEPAQPAETVSHLLWACNLVVLVHGSHLPATRGKVRVPGGRTFMQNFVKRRWELTYLW